MNESIESKRPIFEVPEIEFVECADPLHDPATDRRSQRSPCWDCAKRNDEARDKARVERRKNIPAHFEWCHAEASELVIRVKPIDRNGKSMSIAYAMKTVLAHRGTVVLFQGPSGTGKTSLAVACLRDIGSPHVLFVPARELERAQIEHRAGAGVAPIVDRARRARVTLIDDLGLDKPSNFSAVESVILSRHDDHRMTWITTNFSDAEIQERYGVGVFRRLTEKENAKVIRFGAVRS
jgi:DNA replication protein DnaC